MGHFVYGYRKQDRQRPDNDLLEQTKFITHGVCPRRPYKHAMVQESPHCHLLADGFPTLPAMFCRLPARNHSVYAPILVCRFAGCASVPAYVAPENRQSYYRKKFHGKYSGSAAILPDRRFCLKQIPYLRCKATFCDKANPASAGFFPPDR